MEMVPVPFFTLLRLTEDGKVDLVLGATPEARRLEGIAGSKITPEGRIYAVSQRTSAVHVFGAEGRFSHTCIP